MIVNIKLGNFGGPMRNGDLVALCNVVENMRIQNNDKSIQFHVLPNAINPAGYVQKFYQFLLEQTDYFTNNEGVSELIDVHNLNLWDYRWSSGDLVKIPNSLPKEKKIVVCPLLNAPYNEYRNWTPTMLQKILDKYKDYSDYTKIICIEDGSLLRGVYAPDWNLSIDFMENIHHIMTTEMFAGGDTGTSHFVGALENGPVNIQYYYSGHGVLHTTPINVFNGKGKLNVYWKESEDIL